jgi:23S rRNA (guanosine2251-2'-O)-methyltransferase
MYNDRMPTDSYEIRVCNSCGLRYPLVDEQTFGIRCPSCLGETRIALSRKLVTEPARDRPAGRGETVVLLDNIRSAWNVGSILRSADGFGFTHAYLCGITPTPENETVRKTSLGAEESVIWTYHKDALRLASDLKKDGWKIIALEENQGAIPLESNGLPSRMREQAPGLQILIVGNEVTGVDPELLDLCDTIYYIPMQGQKRSFNVAIAFAIAAYTLR